MLFDYLIRLVDDACSAQSDDYFELPRSKSLTYNLQLLRKAVRANQVSRGTYQVRP